MLRSLPSSFFGEWRILDELGAGGNGQVWRARSTVGGVEAAVKILARLKGDGYDRFRREVSSLEQMLLTDLAVLPVLDAYLPKIPSSDNRPWYAMPIATPLAQALVAAAPREIAREVGLLAHTLARLADEHGMHHRDVKPDNLFFSEGRAVLADFGLVIWTDDAADRLTADGVAAGAWNFAPDDLRQGLEPDWDRFDAYCLAKALWCLIMGRQRPPGGRIRAGEMYSLTTQGIVESYIGELDAVIDRATAENPAQRSTCADLAHGIDLWLDAIEMRDDIVATDVRQRFNRDTVQRWLVGWARTSAASYGKALIDLHDGAAASDVPGLSNLELADALDGLARRARLDGEGFSGDAGCIIGWSRTFPTVTAIEEVESRGALDGETASILRQLHDEPEPMIVMLGEGKSVFGADGPQTYFRLRYLRERDLIEYSELRESGPGLGLMDIHLTPQGFDQLGG